MREPLNKTTYPFMLQAANEVSQPLPPDQGRQGRSIFKELLQFLGWTMAIAAILMTIVTLGGWLVLNNTIRDVFNLDTKVTIVDGAAVVESIKRVNKQIFIEHYNVVDIDYTEAPEGWLRVLPIKQTFVVLLRGRVPAGFDVSELTPQDIWISADHRRVQLLLPPPTIFEDNVNIDFEHSRILAQSDTCPDFICQQTIEAYKNQILPEGRKLLVKASEQSGILEEAAVDGQRYYEQLLKSLGFAEVRVIIRGDDE
jgi:hypothetical protein